MSAAAASMAELGYNVKAFCYQDSARRAHSIAAQGGINAAKNYQNDGDSIFRLFYDTVKGGDFRSREANVHRLAEVSVNIIDQCVAQGVPFAREYGGNLDKRLRFPRELFEKVRGRLGPDFPMTVRMAGNDFVCPLEELKDPGSISDAELENCVEDAVVGRYAGQLKMVDRVS